MTRKITVTSAIAGMYVALTLISSAFGMAFLGSQFRVSEVLSILPLFTPYAIPGLTIGCLISNFFSPFGLLDVIIGTSSTLVSAVLTRVLRNYTVKGIPWLSLLPPVIITPLCVASLVYLTSNGEMSGPLFNSIFFSILVSQAVICYCLGVPLSLLIKKSNIFKN